MRNIYKNNFFFYLQITLLYELDLLQTGTHFGSCYLVCSSCVWFCLHTVESAFGFVLECVITADYGILYCTERVNEGKKRGRAQGGWADKGENELISSSPPALLR